MLTAVAVDDDDVCGDDVAGVVELDGVAESVGAVVGVGRGFGPRLEGWEGDFGFRGR